MAKRHLGHLPQDDDPVLHTFLFASCWMSFILDRGQTSMRELFKHLKIRGVKVDASTFSKVSKHRDSIVFYNFFIALRKQLKKQKNRC